jgi:hypothetical protein
MELRYVNGRGEKLHCAGPAFEPTPRVGNLELRTRDAGRDQPSSCRAMAQRCFSHTTPGLKDATRIIKPFPSTG